VKLSVLRAIPLGTSVAVAASVLAFTTAAPAATNAPAQSVRVVLTAHGPRLSGPTVWRPGAVRIAARSRLADQEVTLLRFRPGYSYADFLADGRKARRHGSSSAAAVARVFAHTIFEGGVDLFRGQAASYTVRVTPGTYYLGEMTARPQLTPIHVAGAPAKAPPRAAGRITATDGGYRISGALPANGTIAFANAGRRPHRVNLLPVKPGTTRAQVVAYIRRTGGRENAAPPPFALNGPQVGTADLSPHRRMQLTYRLPAGTYAAVDFDQDMRTGRPDALEGLVAVVTLR
jgi:hypothetical protein